jgi:hypothetical protein
LSGNISGVWELNPDVCPEIGGLLRNLSESGTDKGIKPRSGQRICWRTKDKRRMEDIGQRMDGGHRMKDGWRT